MITLDSRYKDGSPCYIDVCPKWDIVDPKKKHWLTRRPRVIGEVALRPETNRWVLGPIVDAYRDTKWALEGGSMPDLTIQIPERGCPLRVPDIYDEGYKYKLFRFVLSLPKDGPLNQIEFESRKQADVYEQIATEKLGPYVVKYLVKNYPEMVGDAILRRSINEALVRTKYDIDIAVEARKVHQLSKDSKAVQGIGLAIRKKTIAVGEAMIDTMVYMDYSSGRYQPERQNITDEEKSSISTELFLDSVRAAYPELPEL